MHQLIIALKSDLTADHDAGAGTAGPAAADLALDKRVAVFVADGDAAAAAEALVVGIERTRNPGRRGARVGVGEANGLHWIRGSKGGLCNSHRKYFSFFTAFFLITID